MLRHAMRPAAGLMRRLAGLFGRMVRATDTAVGMLYILPPQDRTLHLVALSGASQRIAAPWARVGLDDAAPVAQAIRERRLIWVASPEELARRYPRIGLVAPYDYLLGAAPIIHGDRAWGAVCLLWPIWHPPQLSQAQHEAISTFCNRAGRLLEHQADQGDPLVTDAEPLILPPARQHAPSRAEAMAAYDYVQRLSAGCCSLDLEGRVRYLNAAGAELLGAGTADLLGDRPWERLLWLNDPAFEDHYRRAAISKQPAVFTALRPPDRWLSFRLDPGSSGISVTIFPAPPEPTDPTKATGTSGFPRAAGASALYQLMYLAATLTEAVTVKDVVDQVAEQLVPAFEAQGLALMTAENGRLRIIGYRGYTAQFMASLDGAPLTALTAAARALASRSPLFFTSYADFCRAYPQAPCYQGRDAWAFLPLVTSGRSVGLLVLSYDHARSFPPAERTVLTSLAGLIAQALDRALLYDTKHQLARSLQTSLLPGELPQIPGLEVAARYLPAGHGTDVGGDFYDIVHCGPTCAAVTIGDVQGHNVQAAALMGQVRTAVRAHAITHATPSNVLARTNRLMADLNPDLFTSCLHAHLDLAGGIARLATAGHPPPLIRHRDGSTETLHLTPGLLLGVNPDGAYPATEIPLPPGVLLALYTDGLVETPSTDIDRATSDLAQYLAAVGGHSVEAVADALLDHALRTGPATDDTALLIVRARQANWPRPAGRLPSGM